MIRLYRAPWSTNVERVTLALAYKALQAESVWIDYGDRRPVEEVSGQPLVPVVDFDGEVVFDSTRILHRLEQLYPEPPLFPADPAVRAELEVFLEWFNEVWKGPPNAIEAELGGLPEHDFAKVGRLSARMSGWLDLFEQLLDGREYLFGEFGAADCAAYPFLKYAAGRDPADDELFHRILADHQSVEGRPRVAAWIERVSRRPQQASA